MVSGIPHSGGRNTFSKRNDTLDTRQYLDYDASEKTILLELLSQELIKLTPGVCIMTVIEVVESLELKQAKAKHTKEWWLSPEAQPHRMAEYLVRSLRLDRDYNLVDVAGRRMLDFPKWPAIWGYDISTDEMFWVEIKTKIQAADYYAAYPNRLNPAAMALLNG